MQAFKNGKDGEKVDVPEGTTHVLFDDDNYTFALYKMNDSISIEIYQNNEWCHWGSKGEHEAECDFIKIEYAIIKDETPTEKWIPQVGEECEATFGTRKNWYKFVIAGDFGFILIGDYWQRKLVSEFESIEFRPLRTKEEIERDAFVETLNAINNSLTDSECLYETLFDMGYRKND